jgi:hypothetical protein
MADDRVVTELLAARKVIEQLPHWSTLNRIANGQDDDKLRHQLYDVANALTAYHQTPKAVLDHQPEPSKER